MEIIDAETSRLDRTYSEEVGLKSTGILKSTGPGCLPGGLCDHPPAL